MKYKLSNNMYKKGYGAIKNRKTGRYKGIITGGLSFIASSLQPFAILKRNGYKKREINVTPSRPY